MPGSEGQLKDARMRVIGTRIKTARKELDITQKDFGEALGFPYYNFVSALETGRSPLPVDKWRDCADLLHFNRAEWVVQCLHQIMPDVYEALFAKKTRREVIGLVAASMASE